VASARARTDEVIGPPCTRSSSPLEIVSRLERPILLLDIVLARYTAFKGQDVAARICRERGWEEPVRPTSSRHSRRSSHATWSGAQIDPAACRRAAEEQFTASRMGEAYLAAYDEVIARAP
jgi:hypothetical protein